MKTSDIKLAVKEDDSPNSTLNIAILHVLPILRRVAKKQSFWLKWGMNALIRAVERYLREEGFKP